MKRNEEFRKFDDTMTQLLKVSHSEIKEKLDAEKTAKRKPSPSRTRKTAKQNPAINSGDKG
jgi:hypothetical protein